MRIDVFVLAPSARGSRNSRARLLIRDDDN
jgi:hypothetical protein